ncbi:hypothetical protein [Microbacterium binotii]|uniref:hypothetical protein n=1 Tax=Microbacterium binotii TaxID=462710 RepID=UPI001F2EC9E5|nr:hypothetical protein [Microbacterium binotii]UIN29286.1 hypothetical protein LXM64_08870 [Microbacterium binotii]
MRRITYAGENVLTTDDVASLLVELTAELAKRGEAAAVRIPIDPDGTAELVVGLGNDVLSVPVARDGDDPDFDSSELEAHLQRVRPAPERHLRAVEGFDGPDDGYDPDYDISEA